MKEQVLEKLARILGPKNVLQDEETLSAYFRDGAPSLPLAAAYPEEPEQVIELTELAAKESVPLFTLKDARFVAPLPETGGIILDFRKMNVIERIDKRNLVAHIQRGVTWDQLGPELENLGLKTLMPAAATSPYVLANMVNRVIMRSAARYPEVQVSNLKVVLADGQVHLTGSHAASEDGGDNKDDGGPNLSRWYNGAEDIYGIPVRGTIWVYPVPQAEEFLFFGFDNLAQALAAIRNIPRREVCTQALLMNPNYLNRLLENEVADARSWLVVLGCEGHRRLVEYHVGVCRKDADALGAKELPELKETFAPALHRVWYRPEYSHGFYTFIGRVEEFHNLVTSRADGHLGELFVSHGYGRAAWCEFDHLEPSPKNIQETYEEIDNLLLETGAYFDRPLGRLAERFYAGNRAYLKQIKRIKDMIDPNKILNPDQLVRGI